jgi:hypothetical protein
MARSPVDRWPVVDLHGGELSVPATRLDVGGPTAAVDLVGHVHEHRTALDVPQEVEANALRGTRDAVDSSGQARRFVGAAP